MVNFRLIVAPLPFAGQRSASAGLRRAMPLRPQQLDARGALNRLMVNPIKPAQTAPFR
jgi:hypothetical protein